MIAVPAESLAAIRAHARQAYPEECCGALVGLTAGQEARVLRLVPLANSREGERRRRFRITSEQYQCVERMADAQGLTLLGFYHSHPDHPAVPSDYDREHALPFFHYVVVAVSRERWSEMTSWVLSEDRGTFEQEILSPQSGQE